MSKKTLKISAVANENNTVAIITIDGYIGDMCEDYANTSANFKAQVNNLISSGIKNAKLYVNSGGGDCFEAAEISNVILNFEGTIDAELGALCASAATYIVSKCNSVIAAANTNYMIHKPMGVFMGNTDEIKADLKALENLQAEYLDAYVKKTGLAADKIEAMWAQDYWMNAKEAKELGFINDYDTEEAEVKDDDVDALTAYKNAPKITATVNKNPINKNQPQANMEYKKLMIQAMAMDSASTDDQVLAQFQAMVAKATKYDAVKTELDAVKETAFEAKINVELDAAINNKQIVAAQREFYKKNYKADFEGTKAELAKLPKINALSLQLDANKKATEGDRSTWKFSDWAEKDPKGLHAMASTDKDAYNALASAHYGA